MGPSTADTIPSSSSNFSEGEPTAATAAAPPSEYSIPTATQKQEWRLQQVELKQRLVTTDDHPQWSVLDNAVPPTGLRYIGGVDLSFIIGNNEDAIASLVILSYPELKVVYENHAKVKLTLPYIAGYLAFREVQPMLALLNELKVTKPELYPQLIMVDGCGILHPRGFGLASHLGLLADTPTIGCSKNYLVIHGDGPTLAAHPPELKRVFREHIQEQQRQEQLGGGSAAVVAQRAKDKGVMRLVGTVSGKTYGAALAVTDSGAQNPIFVSIGHRVSLDTAMALVRTCSLFRVPEPIRQADQKSRTEIRKWLETRRVNI